MHVILEIVILEIVMAFPAGSILDGLFCLPGLIIMRAICVSIMLNRW